MPTFADVGGQEPSTITFRLATVQLTRNSTVTNQEILSIGDPDTTNAIAAVLNTTPGSTAWALAIRDVVPQSTTVNISSLAGPVIVRSSAANALVSVYQSTAADLNVTVAGYVAPSTVVSVSTGSVRVSQSSAADLNVTVAGYSTVSAVSSVSGIVAVRPSDTNWASSAGFHFDSSGALQVAATVTTSTTVNVSSLAGAVNMRSSAANALVSVYQSTAADLNVTVAGYVAPSTVVSVSTGSVRVHQSSAADLNVTVAGYSTIAAISSVAGIVAVRPSDTNWASSAGFHFDSSGYLQTVASFTGSTVVTVSTGSIGIAGVYDSSGALRTVGDSVNDAIRVNVVAGSAAGSTVVTVSTGSVRVHQSSAADLNVTVAGYSTTVNISSLAGPVIVRSSAANALITAYQSTAADLLVTASQGGTWNIGTVTTVTTVSSLAGAVNVRSSAANALVTVYQSTAADLVCNVSSLAGIVAVRPTDTNWASSAGFPFSTTHASSGVAGLLTREIMDGRLTAASTTAFASTSFTIASSVANVRVYVTGYTITTTNAGPTQIGFYSSGTLVWPLVLAATSSAVTGANMAVGHGYIFRGSVNEAMSLRTNQSTIAGWQVGVAYYVAP